MKVMGHDFRMASVRIPVESKWREMRTPFTLQMPLKLSGPITEYQNALIIITVEPPPNQDPLK